LEGGWSTTWRYQAPATKHTHFIFFSLVHPFFGGKESFYLCILDHSPLFIFTQYIPDDTFVFSFVPFSSSPFSNLPCLITDVLGYFFHFFFSSFFFIQYTYTRDLYQSKEKGKFALGELFFRLHLLVLLSLAKG